jgi:hypothetical protein
MVATALLAATRGRRAYREQMPGGVPAIRLIPTGRKRTGRLRGASGHTWLDEARHRELGGKVCPIMFQIVVSGALPAIPGLRSRCLADPDVLLSIAQEESQLSCAEEFCDRFSAILHDLRMGGAWKRTNRGRLKRTEEMLCDHLRPELCPGQGLDFLDIGASDGITTLDAIRTLRRAFGHEVHAFLADRNIWLLRYRRGPVVEYRASDGEPIMARIGPLGVRLARLRYDARPNGDPLARLYLQLKRFRASMQLDTRISLVNPAARSDPGITIMELDCLVYDASLKDSVSAIRASNVLNLGYFSPAQIWLAVGHLYAYMREGGCLVISRNDDQPAGEVENGSVWLKDSGRFRWLQDFGTGSETRFVVDSWPHS